NERIKAEDKIDRLIRNHLQAPAIIHVIAYFRIRTEPLPASIHALRVRLQEMQIMAMLLQVITPPPKSRSDLKDRVRRQRRLDPRQNTPKPLCRRPTPRLRPFFTRGDPFVVGLSHRAFSFHFPATWESEITRLTVSS